LTSDQNGYRLTNGRKVVVSREVRFLASDKAHHKQPETRLGDDESDTESVQEEIESTQQDYTGRVQEESETEEEQEEFQSVEESDGASSSEQDDPQPRRSARRNIGNPPQYLQDYDLSGCFAINDPASHREAMESAEADVWKAAMKNEMNSLEQNGTWELVNLPTGRKTIGSKWIFKTKLDSNGNIERRKARLVAQGFSQKFGIDYHDVFAPVARTVTMKMMLSVAGKKKMSVM
jgi:hypothetical protein